MGGEALGSPQDVVKLARPFKIIAFDWDGTAVMGRQEDASRVNALLDRLLALGVDIIVITGTNLANTTHQLAEVIRGPNNRRLFIATNRGSEVYGFDGRQQPIPLWRRTASPDEERRLTDAADGLRERLLERHGLESRVIYDRLNRRKIDLIPLAEWADPPKSEIGQLLIAVEARLAKAGLRGGLREVMGLAESLAREHGLPDPRVTSDVKHIEIGLTDKSDSVEWMARELCRSAGVRTEEILVAGDEFGAIGGVEGSDYRMVTPHSQGAIFVSVGKEPGGVPAEVIHLGGGPARFRSLLMSQIELHEGRAAGAGAVPYELPASPTTDPRWLVVEQGVDLVREHEIESLTTVGNGYIGTRGSLSEMTLSASSPATFLAGVFDTLPQPTAVPELAVAPNWTRVRVTVEGHELRLDAGTGVDNRRALDLRQGILWREWRHKDPTGRVTLLRSFRLASLSDRRLLLQSLTVTPENYSGRIRVEALVEPPPASISGVPIPRPLMIPVDHPQTRLSGDPSLIALRAPGSGTRAAMAMTCDLRGAPVEARRIERRAGFVDYRWELDAVIGDTYRLDRLVAVATSRDAERPVQTAADTLASHLPLDPARLVEEHAEAWRERWRDTDVQIGGDLDAQQALRFACYHLISAANPEDERVSIGARTLSGESYKGHVFWDTDTFILPMFAFTHPPSARALLMYRYHTLDAARRKARALGCRGALFAWESADTGDETTPRFMLAPDGEVVRILSGDQEHHISADVAHAVWLYWLASGDEEFLRRAGAEILLETARFWSSRGRLERDGRYHIREVIGPDEYHESVDDNAYTNLMAQWNLERGVEAARLLQARFPEDWEALRARLDLGEEELGHWERIAQATFVHLDESTGVIEQYDGFFELDDYDLAPMRARGKRGAAMDILLGREVTTRSKIVKQADVVMALQLLWDRFPPKVREANFRYYEPITCHGSSLSPAVHAVVAARLGDHVTAETYFRQAAQIDLGNNMGNAAGGVHAAALGGLWQAAVFGFGGLELDARGVRFSPALPPSWRSLSFPLQCRGSSVRVSIGQDPPSCRVRVEGRSPPEVRLGEDGEERTIEPGQLFVAQRADGGRWVGWHEVEAELHEAKESRP